MTGAHVSGPALFARYAYPPNELGYCGADDPSALLRQAAGTVTEQDRGRAQQFDGAWPYLEALARAAGVDDPLDPRVIEAYWLGGSLLDSVNSEELVAHLRHEFGTRNDGGLLPDLDGRDRALAHHSFHVLAVYPWVRLLRKHGAVPLSILQNCRIRWGEVREIGDEYAEVESSPLAFDGNRLTRGPNEIEQVRWNVDGIPLAPAPVRGNVVALHWDWLCDSISVKQAEALDHAEEAALEIVNLRLRERRM
ncbi:DUF6390 family protein [Rhodococcus globerulus]|uniref:DUF6390 family protein n=1 Tax=Rhodococcus globerulus TaxID=33008 RepID=UPI000AE427A7|nr:DUF6390 family protein [Rhodococcus globerulus]